MARARPFVVTRATFAQPSRKVFRVSAHEVRYNLARRNQNRVVRSIETLLNAGNYERAYAELRYALGEKKFRQAMVIIDTLRAHNLDDWVVNILQKAGFKRAAAIICEERGHLRAAVANYALARSRRDLLRLKKVVLGDLNIENRDLIINDINYFLAELEELGRRKA